MFYEIDLGQTAVEATKCICYAKGKVLECHGTEIVWLKKFLLGYTSSLTTRQCQLGQKASILVWFGLVAL